MKHAFLILAHGEFEILRSLIGRLDDPRNDIYVHFDKKVRDLPKLSVNNAGLIILSERVDVRWGDLSMVLAELALFKAAAANGPYQYFHLLSGVDLPLKSQDRIHAFFEKHQGQEFIGYTLTSMTPETARRVQYRHLFPEDFKNKSLVKRAIRAAFLRAQMVLGIRRNKGQEFQKGSQWVSVTERMAELFISSEDWIRRTFKQSFCCDELVMQTLCWRSPLRDNLFNTRDDGLGCMREISWRENPASHEWTIRDWEASDFEALKGSPALFARKFNSSDPGFIEKVLKLSDSHEG